MFQNRLTVVAILAVVSTGFVRGGEAFPKDKATASIKGTVSFEGTAPKRMELDTTGDPKCAAHRKDALLREDVIITDGKLKNVIVYVKKGAEMWTFATPPESKTIDQLGCQYIPHVFGIMINQSLIIKNSDDLAHNVHAVPTINQEFNESQPKPGEITKKFSEPELPVKINCDIHKWMSAVAGVFSHPFYAVTADDGSFEIKGLPPGQYEIEAWHESSKKLNGPHAVTVTLADKEAKVQDFKFALKAK